MLILVADDDPDDCMIIKEAWEKSKLACELRFVGDGEELIDYLCRSGKYFDPASPPRPDLILLDLNMPRKDGREALKEIKGDPYLKRIPITVLTTSREQEDIHFTYDTGVNSFINKPSTFSALIDIMKGLYNYWFEIVKLPADELLC